jgi:hypothetical protein
MAAVRLPLGYSAAHAAVKARRASFFGSEDADLPQDRAPEVALDDRIPQFGFIGRNYLKRRVLLVGINPGNGKATHRSAQDAAMIPAHATFFSAPNPENFLAAQAAYKAQCQTWAVWRRHCSEIIGAGRLDFEEVAYTNVLPWRTESQSNFADHVAESAVRIYLQPFLADLAPIVFIALGKRAAELLALNRLSTSKVVVWNRSQAATPAVIAERRAAAAQLFELLG